ncbi:MAG: aldo/keto reductase [Candidatus Marinimicrobia bacterium]|nr:aldo/keto reductase [Candidatus Neomarinimicrobiota bacterium]MCF7828504.1 aldo/keto reductase [Candidatus Neomarinimicrobiota bacterium]MCF7881994.1 aldo/keto reductase [Candidatus Neomarinimicrobiota bacterium]
MEYTYLGRTGLQVSRLCLGTMNFGPHTSEEDSFAIMNRARELGINFFDTANVYGWSKGKGTTERIIGKWLAEDSSRRDEIVLASKVYGSMADGGPNDGGLSAYHIKKACEDSLRRLRTDHLDLYQMHHIDRNTPWEEIWQAMEQLVREGKVLYVGSSNFPGWNIAKAQELASKRNFMGLVSEQSIYNLGNRNIELEVIPACQEYGLGLIPWSPLNSGMLAGGMSEVSEGRRTTDRAKNWFEPHKEALKEYETFCAELGEHPAVVALAWLQDRPAVTAPIVGPRTLEQLESSARALDFKFNDDIREKLDEIWPGPGGTAPEAYAW